MGKQTTWAISWVRNGYANPYEIAYVAPYAVAAFRAQLLRHGFVHAAAIYRKEKQQHPCFSIPEQDMHTFAAILAEGGHTRDAAEILKLK